MRKLKVSDRRIDFFSQKNRGLVSVATEEMRSYSKHLEQDESISSYQTQIPLKFEKLLTLSTVGIRKDYLCDGWTTDFFCLSISHTVSVREIVQEKELSKLPTIEKLELSRRYWQSLGVTDWKIIIVED